MPDSLASFYSGRSVCVTGGAGFIGSHLVDALVELGAKVTVLDDLSTGLLGNLSAVDDRIRFIEASILDPAGVCDAVQECDVVFHQAAMTSVPRSVEEPQASFETNSGGTQMVLESARRAGVTRFVYASSSSVYGDQEASPKVESMQVDPRSPYAVSKLMGEYLLKTYSICYGMSTVCLRYFNIFGPRQRPDSAYAAVIPKFADAMLRGETPVIFGDGTQTRDFTYVANAVNANLRAGAAEQTLEGATLNVACGVSTVLIDLTHRLAELLGVECSVDYQPERVGEVKHSLADVSKAASLIGYDASVDLETGLQHTLEAIRAKV